MNFHDKDRRELRVPWDVLAVVGICHLFGMARLVLALCAMMLHVMCADAEIIPAFAGVAPVSRLRGGGFPQFWVNKDELQAAPEKFKAGFARLRAMCEGAGGGSASSGMLKGGRLAGTWSKVETVGQEKAMLMLGLNVVFRKAAILLSTVRIKSDETTFEVTTKGAVVVSIKERYGFDGSVSACSRRDKRWGKHAGKIVEASQVRGCPNLDPNISTLNPKP